MRKQNFSKILIASEEVGVNFLPLEIIVYLSTILFVGMMVFSIVKVRGLRKGIKKARQRLIEAIGGSDEMRMKSDKAFAKEIKSLPEEVKSKPGFALGLKLFKKRSKQRMVAIIAFIASSVLLLITSLGALSVISYFYITSLVQAVDTGQLEEKWLLFVFKFGIPAFVAIVIALAAFIIYSLRDDA